MTPGLLGKAGTGKDQNHTVQLIETQIANHRDCSDFRGKRRWEESPSWGGTCVPVCVCPAACERGQGPSSLRSGQEKLPVQSWGACPLPVHWWTLRQGSSPGAAAAGPSCCGLRAGSLVAPATAPASLETEGQGEGLRPSGPDVWAPLAWRGLGLPCPASLQGAPGSRLPGPQGPSGCSSPSARGAPGLFPPGLRPATPGTGRGPACPPPQGPCPARCQCPRPGRGGLSTPPAQRGPQGVWAPGERGCSGPVGAPAEWEVGQARGALRAPHRGPCATRSAAHRWAGRCWAGTAQGGQGLGRAAPRAPRLRWGAGRPGGRPGAGTEAGGACP